MGAADDDNTTEGAKFSPAPKQALRPRESRVPTRVSEADEAAPASVRGEQDPLLGRLIGGRYRLLQELGQGAMGRVYQGVHEALGTGVAVKVMRRSMSGSEEYARRFAREARAAAMLAHPNVVQVLDFGDEQGLPYIVMEYVEGPDMDRWLEGRRGEVADWLPPVELVVELGDQVLGALEAAHACDIVHRDLKPENVLLATLADGALLAKVADFGLARMEDPRDTGPTLTQQDAVAGTPAYMSPEQCRSLKVGPSTDLYAFGCLLTFLLQGAPPFRGKTSMDVVSQQMFLEPPPLARPARAGTVPPQLERLRRDLLSKAIHQRPATASEARGRLRASLTQLDAPSSPSVGPPAAQRVGSTAAPSRTSDARGQTVPAGPLVVALRICGDGRSRVDTLGEALAVHDIELLADPKTPATVTLVDAGAEPNAAFDVLAELSADTGALVLAAGLNGELTNRLIAAGAADVARPPLSAEALARKLRRVNKRR